ncbi:hypothetical protein QLL95_gp0822 [Cotonvirus japonicus]|uniref:Uncharacterized protein n=1 Tax=Cotonvirus japonicus TaxID=2811091 RepID=A0ABM7NT72_9VIRU|nr:hypothetical protein QLL95_gp0822 [Cotonvirus japonicus]BCS83301.1 hypothetical protein [Cotonvirus japonicus]
MSYKNQLLKQVTNGKYSKKKYIDLVNKKKNSLSSNNIEIPSIVAKNTQTLLKNKPVIIEEYTDAISNISCDENTSYLPQNSTNKINKNISKILSQHKIESRINNINNDFNTDQSGNKLNSELNNELNNELSDESNSESNSEINNESNSELNNELNSETNKKEYYNEPIKFNKINKEIYTESRKNQPKNSFITNNISSNNKIKRNMAPDTINKPIPTTNYTDIINKIDELQNKVIKLEHKVKVMNQYLGRISGKSNIRVINGIGKNNHTRFYN